MTYAGQTVVIATADGPPLSYPNNSGFHDKVIHETFIKIENVHLPAERALINANSGIEEGVYVRIEGLDKYYPDSSS